MDADGTRVSAKNGVALFEDENDDQHQFSYSTDDFGIKPQFFSEAGQRLLRHQSKFNGDPRFKMDDKFLGDFESDKEEQSQEDEAETSKDDDVQNERAKQLSIAKKVLGEAATNLHGNIDFAMSPAKKKKRHFAGARFNPDDPSHYIYEVSNHPQKAAEIDEFLGQETDESEDDEQGQIKVGLDCDTNEARQATFGDNRLSNLVSPTDDTDIAGRQPSFSFKLKPEFIRSLKDASQKQDMKSTSSSAATSKAVQPLNESYLDFAAMKGSSFPAEDDEEKVRPSCEREKSNADTFQRPFFLLLNDEEVIGAVKNFPIVRQEAIQGWKESREALVNVTLLMLVFMLR
ncbi:unnamed protein product [Soboliphyme baturini]|uniref:PAX3-and PAX7-binding protein 1 n=1 Tax=Soboliphyme baturini TaxID=241478 RepID=A0A183IQV9_9BILA|nr:unnamed protein product [Soboliphyme baturini]